MSDWSLNAWRRFSYQQSVRYQDETLLETITQTIRGLPPLVTKNEINELRRWFTQASLGRAFIIQGGDCAESFQACRAPIILNTLALLNRMSQILEEGINQPVVKIGRIAGQYAKPRSEESETRGELSLPSYRGDLINSIEFNSYARKPDPLRLLQGFHCAAMTLNCIRAHLRLGLSHNRFYTSHEALHLHYEEAQTHSIGNEWYNLSTHFPWIGMRTFFINSAHVEFLRGIRNPIGIKVGPLLDPSGLIELIARLNPLNESGKIVLITRLGEHLVKKELPSFIHAIKKADLDVTWMCDPMHGNTLLTQAGFKTRKLSSIWAELLETIKLHESLDSILGGIHLEVTGEEVVECMGGSRNFLEKDLWSADHSLKKPTCRGLSTASMVPADKPRDVRFWLNGQHSLEQTYKSLVDPRLNYHQALEISERVARAYLKAIP